MSILNISKARISAYFAMMEKTMLKQLQKALGANVKRLRKEQGYSQESFADESGLSQAYLSRVERGVANPQLDRLQKIALCLGISIAELFQFDTADTVPKELEAEEKARRIAAVFQELPHDVIEKLYNSLAAQIKRK